MDLGSYSGQTGQDGEVTKVAKEGRVLWPQTQVTPILRRPVCVSRSIPPVSSRLNRGGGGVSLSFRGMDLVR